MTFNFVAVRQDYLWFVALLVWLAIGALWWRWGRREAAWGWLGWSALAAVGMCAGELAILATAVSPGPDQPSHLWGDLWLGSCMAVLTGGWWQALAGHGRQHRWLWIPCAGLAAGRYWSPDIINLLLALLFSAAAFAWSRKLRFSEQAARLGLGAAWLAGLLASSGALADALDQRRRWMEVSHVGVIAAVALLGAGLLVARGLAKLMFHVWPTDVHSERMRDARVFLHLSGWWLLAGFVLSALAGEAAQAMFERSALTRLHAMAMALDPRALERGLGPELRVESTMERRQPSGRLTIFGVSTFQAGPDAEPVRRIIKELRAANPDVRTLRIRTFRDGHVLLGPGAHQAWSLTLEHPITQADEADWRNRVRDFRGMVYTSYDEISQARVPLISTGDEMLGWLVMDLHISSWMAAQTQARVSIFAVVVLGLGVLALWCVQRWREREREAARQAATLAVAADKLKASFLAKVSHELRTPLQGILGFGEMAHARAADSAQRHQLEALMQHGRILTRLVNDLIDLSAMEAGGLSLRPEPAHLPELLTRPVEALQPRVAAKGLELAIETHGPAGTWIMADPERVGQIALNLAGNAIKFTARGRISVVVNWEPLADGRIAVGFKVADTGPGITAEQRARLFHPFSRLPSGDRQEGVGLGLAITAGLCERMGGGVTVESDGVSGSVFHATLILPSAPPASVAEPPIGVTLFGQRILVADDNALVRELFVAYLLQLGARCAGVADGALAWERIRREDFDVLVLDLSMPGLDGLALVRRVCARPGKRPRLIAASAHAREEHRAEALAAGFDEFLVKPVPLEALAIAICPGAGPKTTTLDRLRASLGERFRAEVPAQAEQLRRFVNQAAWPEVRQLTHHLKNSAFAVDDPALVAALTPLEEAAATGQPAAVAKAWPPARDSLAVWMPTTTEIIFRQINSDPAES